MHTRVLVAIMLVALFLIASSVMDPAINQIVWWTVNGGGGVSSGGSYSLSATIGQADAGILSGGEFRLIGGFWGGTFATYEVSLPLILR